MVQKDLFDESQNQKNSNRQNLIHEADFLHHRSVTIRFDQLLAGFIGLLILGGAIYAVGFEMGKKLYKNSHDSSASQLPSSFKETAALTVDANPTALQIISEGVAKEPGVSQTTKVISPIEVRVLEQTGSQHAPSFIPEGKFTIQVVAFANSKKNAAVKLKKKLQEQGLHSFILTGRVYENVCTNGFTSKLEAENFLKGLKSQGIVPPDAYVRNMA